MPRNRIGLEQGAVALFPHSPQWKLAFQSEREVLLSLLGDFVVDICHIGSTAIPTLSAKPIIDILVALHRFSDIEMFKSRLEETGYEYRENGSNEMRILFVKGPEEKRTHHIHFTEYQSAEWEKAFTFWEYLHAHPKELAAYEKLKQQLAEEYPSERDKYSKGKAPFIESIIKKAQKENRPQEN